MSGKAAVAFLRSKAGGSWLSIERRSLGLRETGRFSFRRVFPGGCVAWGVAEPSDCAKGEREGDRGRGRDRIGLPPYSEPLRGSDRLQWKNDDGLLIAHILREAGKKARAVGNVGTSLCGYLLEGGSA